MIDTRQIWDTLTYIPGKLFRGRTTLEQHIAVFGESGSGKTTLLSAFYGWQGEPDVQDKCGYGLLATDSGTGQRLRSDYLKMSDDLMPPATRHSHEAVEFKIKVRDMSSSPGKLVWHDYPGGWWSGTYQDTEGQRKIEAFKTLLQSDVAIFLCDGAELHKHGGKYLKGLIRGFREELERLTPELAPDGMKLNPFPRVWILALSKADLFPGKNVEWFKDEMIKCADKELASLRKVLGELVRGKEFLSVGEDFLLLSSAQFDPATGKVKDAKKHVGLELIMPLAIVLPILRSRTWCNALHTGAKTSRHVAEALRSLTTNWMKYLPFVGNVFHAFDDAAKSCVDKLKNIEQSARKRGDAVEAVVAALAARLRDKETKKVYYSSKEI